MREDTDIPANAVEAEAARLAAQKKRNLWLALVLVGFVILVGVMSAVRLIENVQIGAGG